MRDKNTEISTFLGGRPVQVVVKLAVISLLVGGFMAFFGLRPEQILSSTIRFVVGIFENGFAVFGEVGQFIVAGATLVVPIWAVMRFLAYRRDNRHDQEG